jgi:hypothetical protein
MQTFAQLTKKLMTKPKRNLATFSNGSSGTCVLMGLQYKWFHVQILYSVAS